MRRDRKGVRSVSGHSFSMNNVRELPAAAMKSNIPFEAICNKRCIRLRYSLLAPYSPRTGPRSP